MNASKLEQAYYRKLQDKFGLDKREFEYLAPLAPLYLTERNEVRTKDPKARTIFSTASYRGQERGFLLTITD